MTAALVLLPGLDGTGDLFAPLIDQLRGVIDTVVVRYPTAEPLSYSELKALARQALPQDQAYVLLGESFSGPIAIQLAAEKPSGLIGLVLCASFVSTPISWLRPLKSLVPLAPIGLLARMFGPQRLMGRFQTVALTRVFREVLGRISTRVLRSRILAAMEIDASAELAQVGVPAMYIRATEDTLLPESAVDGFRRNAVGGRVVDIVGPHSLALCVPGALSAAIAEFTSSLSRASNSGLHRTGPGRDEG